MLVNTHFDIYLYMYMILLQCIAGSTTYDSLAQYIQNGSVQFVNKATNILSTKELCAGRRSGSDILMSHESAFGRVVATPHAWTNEPNATFELL